ncbi:MULTISPECIES: helix-turn-helix transcriptional regulator [unclassified Streptomyces]|uniref:helix-turn-helix domain-containing protein n=1 Tax=unclassified Streptomyces TaxID=2593676 RepID=UPI0006F2658F|nr:MULTISPECIES: helix-turn-helix transcriptional regulator [unclassified Streptomyces]KQX59321.1 DNA-binding protein [Streptomyces sp. Root1304]KRB00582.1 DNA-binding protein [Streptomyces sp. Root66D1]
MNKGNSRSPGAAKAFGRLLRFYRERAGISQEALGRETGYSKSQVAMIERGERRAKGDFVAIADGMLGAQGALLEVAAEVPLSAVAAWFEDYLEEEAKAAGIHAYANQLIPGLLQTPDYARAVFNCANPPWEDDEREAMIENRMARHAVFHRKPFTLIRFVLEKTALTRPIGGSQILRDNLIHILDVARLRNVEIQVMPEDRETHAGLDGPFTLLETEARKGQLVYVEWQSGRYFLTEQPELGDAFARYGSLRAQALTPEESADFIEQVARKL